MRGQPMKTKMKLSTKIIIGSGMIIVLLFMMTSVYLYSMKNIDSQLSKITHINNYKLALANKISTSFYIISLSIRDLTLAKDPEVKQNEVNKITQTRAEYAKTLEAM